MKTLVTGGDGLLGGNLVRELLSGGNEVRVLIHPASKSRTLDGLDIDRMGGDILKAEDAEKATRGCEAVFHVAASTAMWPPRDPKITAINVDGTRNMLDAAEKNGVKRFVHCGSASSFGFGTKKKPGDEDSPYKYHDIGLAYYDSKLAAQKLVLERAGAGRIDALVINPTFMFGPFDSGPSSGEMILQLVKMKLPFYPPGGRNFVHVRDVARGMILAFEKGGTGECYIMGHENLSMKELFTIIAEIAGIRPPVLEIPKDLLMAAGRVGTFVGDLTGKKPKVSRELAISSTLCTYYTAAKAVKEFGLPQTPVRTALEDSYNWLRDNGYMDR